MSSVRIVGAALALAGVAMLSGCDRSDAGSPARDHSTSATGAGAAHGAAAAKPRTPAPLLNGKPIWADNREHSAQENVDYQFDKWGSSVGAHDSRDYALKARTFIEHPPHGAEKVSRPNGDVMVYDKVSNTFAIVRKDGAPRLFRKPVGGAADWEKAKSDASNSGSYRSRKRYNAPNARDFRSGGGDQ